MPAKRPYLHRLAARLGIIPGYVDATGVRRFTSDATRVALIEAMGWEARTEKAARDSLSRLEQEQTKDADDQGPVSTLQHRADGRSCWRPRKTPATGVHVNLYSLRSRRHWGVGDLTDLAAVVRSIRESGGSFVSLNPLHATRNRPPQVSPYSPLSRLFLNPLYLDVEAVPEFVHCAAARKMAESPAFQRSLRILRGRSHLDYAGIIALKYRLLRLLYGEFLKRQKAGSLRRDQAYDDFAGRAFFPLHEFGIFCALDDHFRISRNANDWQRWPAPYRNRRSRAVSGFCEQHERDIAFHRWLQYALDRQLTNVENQAQQSVRTVCLYQDIAVGSMAGGFDTWLFPDLFVRGVDLGCPPDTHSSAGQNWSFPPINPWSLQRQGYHYWFCILRSAMRHAGMVRIDHAMGLMRQFWIPKGRPPSEGAYVRYPMNDLLGILALESRNHQCMVVGEDLGTVPRGFSDTLKKWGILSTRLMMFERTRRGRFRKPSEYREFAVTSATNHDLPPLKGFLEGTDLALRKRIGLFQSKAAWEKAVRDRRSDVRALLRRLVREGLLDKKYLNREPRASARASAQAQPDRTRRDPGASVGHIPYYAVLEAVHRFLARTPSKIIAVMLDDLFGETEPINLPGVGPDKHPSWTRRMSRTLEEGLNDPAVIRAFRAAQGKGIRRRRRRTQKKSGKSCAGQ